MIVPGLPSAWDKSARGGPDNPPPCCDRQVPRWAPASGVPKLYPGLLCRGFAVPVERQLRPLDGARTQAISMPSGPALWSS